MEMEMEPLSQAQTEIERPQQTNFDISPHGPTVTVSLILVVLATPYDYTDGKWMC